MLNSGTEPLLNVSGGGAFLQAKDILKYGSPLPILLFPRRPEAGRCFPDEQPTVGGQFFDAVRSPSRRKGKCYTDEWAF
jgi:hypothetical protein